MTCTRLGQIKTRFSVKIKKKEREKRKKEGASLAIQNESLNSDGEEVIRKHDL